MRLDPSFCNSLNSLSCVVLLSVPMGTWNLDCCNGLVVQRGSTMFKTAGLLGGFGASPNLAT